MCRQCLQSFEAAKSVGFVISEKDAESVFCSGTCMIFFISHNVKSVECFACGNRGNYYRMIRSTSSEENCAWCSLYCLHKNRCSPNLKLMNGPMLNGKFNGSGILNKSGNKYIDFDYYLPEGKL